jgi:2-succinyl-5-enolpyruvyl-6-hydroxy-3-cyclohexene-1-carboxylate synthase
VNAVGEWCRAVVGAFAESGVRSVVVSPGSRSTPLVYAAATRADLDVVHVIDERDAGFFALGIAKTRNEPVLLLCTSGSAGAHYLPALLEASHTYVPLIALTADRPLSLQGCGANQTVDQTKLFGDSVRLFAELELPDLRPHAIRAARRTVARVVTAAKHPRPGPVHLNARFEKPLEPDSAATDPSVAALLAEPITTVEPPEMHASPRAIARLASAVDRAERGFVVAGPALVGSARLREAAFELCRRTGFWLLADPASQLRFAGAASERVPKLVGFDAILKCDGIRPPDLVVQLGAMPVGGGYERWLSTHTAVPRFVLSEHEWPDPTGTAREIVLGSTPLSLRETLARIAPAEARRIERSADEARSISDRVRREVAALIDGPELTEGAIARAVVRSLPDGALLSIGNSLPIRLVDRYAIFDEPDVMVSSQRGTSGIDGLVAGVAGAAHASRSPAVLLIGDVSFLHDLGGLASAAALETPLAIVVINNDGGRIFEQLPVARAPGIDPIFSHWTTPHGRTFEHAARLFELDYERCAGEAQLSAAIARTLQDNRRAVIECTVPPSGAHAIDSALDARIAGAMKDFAR